MGDVVGAHEPHVIHAEALVKKILAEQEGVNLEDVPSVWIRNFATSVASFSHEPTTEEALRGLIANNPEAKNAWSILCRASSTDSDVAATKSATKGCGGIADVISLC